jgi:integrase
LGRNRNARKQRVVAILNAVRTILKSIEPVNEFVFANDKGELFKEDYITKYWKKIVRAAGLNDKINLHSLRASFTSWLAEKDVPTLVIQELLGHTHFTTTEKYLTISVDEQRKALNKNKPKQANSKINEEAKPHSSTSSNETVSS